MQDSWATPSCTPRSLSQLSSTLLHSALSRRHTHHPHLPATLSSPALTRPSHLLASQEVAKSGENPLAYEHFEASGSDVEFKALLFVPPRAPSNFYDEFYTRKPDVRLYVRRVFITDDFEDILPTYLRRADADGVV